MIQRPFGTTGIYVSPLGLGTVKLGRNQGVKYPQGFALPTDAEALALIDRARELGVNLIDTAPAYGTSETRLGELLRGQRKHWIICSKVGEEFVDGNSQFDFSAEHTRASIERSLRRLNTDVIDIVLVHSDGDDCRIIEREGALEQLAELKRQGKIRAFGMSTKTVAGGLLAAAQSDGVMVTYNLRERDERAVIDYCAQHQKGVFIKKALASGHLCNDIGSAPTDPVQASMNFVLNTNGVTSAIVGTINPRHLQDNVARARSALSDPY
ncbi:aldo/keto reductase [Simiduia aestuariiviva]|uniref:Aryl-alcohol dehydrogenase-like predicted oxidoreductase n=1 Tax=Simiduia aestuariiviva TaxID=1510459 RepID=A0A839UMS0_9GAMM|nr:aldo/keto reductase [Simiduia aestuariiviva]MBB3166868.1 aryl-alcohol dehydrogenase-like predicted oxidoreductase [Simiduia aestuariiviva]